MKEPLGTPLVIGMEELNPSLITEVDVLKSKLEIHFQNKRGKPKDVEKEIFQRLNSSTH